jgi:WD40 repeat protein
VNSWLLAVLWEASGNQNKRPRRTERKERGEREREREREEKKPILFFLNYWPCPSSSSSYSSYLHLHTHTHSHSLSLALTRSHSLSLALTRSHSLSLALTHSHALSRTHSLSCSLVVLHRIWDTKSWECLRELRDNKETSIEEFYCTKFTPDSKLLFACGKLKDRHQWSEDDEGTTSSLSSSSLPHLVFSLLLLLLLFFTLPPKDNVCLPAPIKLFDVLTGEVINKLEGHTEEILSMKLILFRDEPYLLSCSQDGFIIRWQLSNVSPTILLLLPFPHQLTHPLLFSCSRITERWSRKRWLTT